VPTVRAGDTSQAVGFADTHAATQRSSYSELGRPLARYRVNFGEFCAKCLSHSPGNRMQDRACRDNLTLNDRNHTCRSFVKLELLSGGESDLLLRRVDVSLSPSVNERLPAWTDLLSAHDVAGLTRRPTWVLLSLAVLGRFPQKKYYHGRSIGWLQADVLEWLEKNNGVAGCIRSRSPARYYLSGRQLCLPFGYRCAARRPRHACSLQRIARR